ncbi:DnaJ domain-containing protein [Kiloniella sp.]|uniref:DnaJ domain-containing protein n=1 Tax=Kiloniella sp. TaxID=1938587 RepID=UPI003B011A18
MPYFILGLGLLAGLIFLAHWYSQANPAIVIKTLKTIVFGTGLLIALFLIFTGRIFLVLAAIPLLLPFLLRSRSLLQRLKAATGGTRGSTSQVVTRFLRMTLVHDSGEMDGEVLSGAHEGCKLSELSLVAIEQLYRVYLIEENKSADLLSAYAERRFGSDWLCGEGGNTDEQSNGNGTGFSSPAMDRKNAFEILGLDETASEEDIREAHKNLMQKLHPDHGGNNYLATQVNRAKDVLLKGSG